MRLLVAKAVPLGVDNIDTDQIFPARYMSRDRRDGGFGGFFLHDVRFDPFGARRTETLLDDPRTVGARIVVAAANYGCGSGRPGAIFSHLDFGIRVVIAESFGPVFSAVAYKSGLLTVQLDRDAAAGLRDELDAAPGTALTVDVEGQRVLSPGGIDTTFAIDPFVKRVVSEGLSEIEMTRARADGIAVVEARRRVEVPWLRKGL